MSLHPGGRACGDGASISRAVNPRTASPRTMNPGGVVIRAVVTAAPFLPSEVQPLADSIEECRHSQGLSFHEGFSF